MGFSDESFKGVATYLATTFKEDASDEDIDNAIAVVEVLLKTFYGDADRRATAAFEKAKKEAASKKQEAGGAPDPKKDEPGQTDDMPGLGQRIY